MKWLKLLFLTLTIFTIAQSECVMHSMAMQNPVEINVPIDYPTIQSAIDAANDGDTILVGPGTYFEQINFLGKSIELRSIDGPELTVIDGDNYPSHAALVTFTNGEGRDTILEGFTIQNGWNFDGNGGGIWCKNADPTIQGNIIRDNSAASYGYGDGIYAENCDLLIAGNSFQNNPYEDIFLRGGMPVISENGFSGDYSKIRFTGSAVTIQNNRPSGSFLSIEGESSSSITIIGNYLEGSSDRLLVVSNCSGLIHRNVINSKTGGDLREALAVGGGTLSITNNLIIGVSNIVFIGSTTDLDFHNNTIIMNGQGGSGAVRVYGSLLTISNSIIWGEGEEWTAVHAGSDSYLWLNNNFLDPARINAVYFEEQGTVTGDPLFVDASIGNYRLQSDSHAIDTGDNSVVEDGETDLDGNPRIVNDIVDIGAYEYTPIVCDSDGDGFDRFECGGTDCDDFSAEVNPDAIEVCDDVDNDCDSTVDEGDAVDASTWYEDKDGDGFGNANLMVPACDQPAGYVANPDDCNDANTGIHPFAEELCDDVDLDCDGDLYNVDEDGDGFRPYSCFGDDCDDSDPTINPDAMEDPSTPIDENCNGVQACSVLPGRTVSPISSGALLLIVVFHVLLLRLWPMKKNSI